MISLSGRVDRLYFYVRAKRGAILRALGRACIESPRGLGAENWVRFADVGPAPTVSDLITSAGALCDGLGHALVEPPDLLSRLPG